MDISQEPDSLTVKPVKKLGRGKLQTYMEKTHLPISLDRSKKIERDDFFKAGGTYKSHMNTYNSQIERNLIKLNKNLVKNYGNREIHEHHKTNLLKQGSEIYDLGFKPQKNPFVTNH